MTAWATALVWICVFVVLVGIPVISLVVQLRRTKAQRVVLKDGVLSVADGVSATMRNLPVDRVGTVVYLPERSRGANEGTNGIWTWGGILILGSDGRVVRHIEHIPGSSLPLQSIYQQIPAPVHVVVDSDTRDPYSRRAFLRRFPKSLRFGQLWGATTKALAITLAICVGLPVLVVVGSVIAAVIIALVETFG